MGLFRRGGNVRDTDDTATRTDDGAVGAAGEHGDATVGGGTQGGTAAGAPGTPAAFVAGHPGEPFGTAGTPGTHRSDAAPLPDAADRPEEPADAATSGEPADGATGTSAPGAGTTDAPALAPAAPAPAPVTGTAPGRTTRPAPGGPWDVSEVQGLGRRVDLGAIWVPGVVGMELRMEVDKKTNQVTGVGITLAGSSLQVQAFAAPRTEGIWDEIRAEIAESVTKQGGAVDELAGPFGRELLARLPVRTPEGRTGHRPVRFMGHDGPRWFLRGVLTGAAAVDARQAALLEALFAGIVVVRGTEARAPRELLTLRLPGGARPAGAPVAPTAAPTLDPLARGPEITETR